MAHGVLEHVIKQENLEHVITHVDSCGTGAYHEGSNPDPRTMDTLARHKINFNHKARQLTRDDFTKFDYILAMDRSNLAHIRSMAPPHSTANIKLFGDYTDGRLDKIVKDPYYESNNAGFDRAYEQCTVFSQNLIKEVQTTDG